MLVIRRIVFGGLTGVLSLVEIHCKGVFNFSTESLFLEVLDNEDIMVLLSSEDLGEA